MHRFKRPLRAAILALACLGAPAVAAADVPANGAVPAAAPSSEATRLGREMAHALFSHTDFRALMASRLGDIDHTFDDFKGRPAWSGYLREAALDEIVGIQPLLEQLFGEQFAKLYTLDELQAGVGFLHGAAGEELARNIGAAAAGGQKQPLSANTQREMQKLAHTPAGRAWLTKLEHLGEVVNNVQDDFIAAFVLGAFHRFVDKAEAAEAARHAPN